MRRVREICCVVLIAVSVIFAFVIIIPQIQLSNLNWAVSVGDTYQFGIESWGEYNYGNYDESETDELVSLNGTVINVTITHLPPLDFNINKATFENNIIEVMKISCIFDNGTEIPTTWKNVITRKISGCIMPVGAWSAIDAFHPNYDQVDFGYGDANYFSQMHDGSFQFGSKWWGMDDAAIWTGTISLDSGFPSLVSWSYDHMYGPIGFELTLR